MICPSSKKSSKKKIYVPALNIRNEDEIDLIIDSPLDPRIDDTTKNENDFKQQLDTIINSERTELSHLQSEKVKYDKIVTKFQLFEDEFEAVKNMTQDKLKVVEDGIEHFGSSMVYIPELVYSLLACFICFIFFKIYDVSSSFCSTKKGIKNKSTIKEQQPLNQIEEAEV